MEKEDRQKDDRSCYVPKSTATKMREEIVDAVVKEIKQKEQVCCIFL